MKRCFVAIDIPENIKKDILKIQDSLPEFKGKLTESENLHLTLKFLGEISEDKIEKVKRRLREINFQNFKTDIGSIGVFSEKFVKIIWLYLTNCERLQKKRWKNQKENYKKQERI